MDELDDKIGSLLFAHRVPVKPALTTEQAPPLFSIIQPALAVYLFQQKIEQAFEPSGWEQQS